MAHDDDQLRQGVSPKLDELSSALMGDAFDMLAGQGHQRLARRGGCCRCRRFVCVL